MKVDLSITLAPQTDSKAPAIVAGDAELFAQELMTAQGIAGGVVPDTGPPDPGPAPGIPGVGEAVPFQPNAEEQTPDLQPQNPASTIPVVIPQDYLLAASFVQGLVKVPSGLTDTPVKVAQNPVQAITSNTNVLQGGDWMLSTRASTVQELVAEVGVSTSPGQQPLTVSFPKESIFEGIQLTALPVESDSETLNGDFTFDGLARLEKGQVLDTKMLAALSPIALSVTEVSGTSTPIIQPSLQELISGMRKTTVPVTAPPATEVPEVLNLDVRKSDFNLTTSQSSSVIPMATTNGSGLSEQTAGLKVTGATSALSSADPALRSQDLFGAPIDLQEFGENMPVEVNEDNVLIPSSSGTQPLTQPKIVATPAIALPREVANEVVNQLIDRIQEMEAFRPNNQMVMKLNPEHLGAITIVLRTSKGETEAEITSSNEQVHQALDAARPALQRTIEVKGVNLTSLSLQLGSEGGSAPQQEQSQEAKRAHQLFEHVPLRSIEIEPPLIHHYNLNETSNLNLVI